MVKDLVGKKAMEVISKLKFINRSARPALLSALEGAVANAVNNNKMTAENLVIKNITVNEGMKMKRGAKGRNARTDRGVVVKRTSHMEIVLDDSKSDKMTK